MYNEYTMMAGGHNPRAAEAARFRNRLLHKLQFFEERYGMPLCTGCGRCISACPQKTIHPMDSRANEILVKKIAEYSLAVTQNRPCFHVSLIMDVVCGICQEMTKPLPGKQ